MLDLNTGEATCCDVVQVFWPSATAKTYLKSEPLWLTAFEQNRRDGLGNGSIAAWAADEDLLGHHKQVDSHLQEQLRAGHLRSAYRHMPADKAFIAALTKLLHEEGYL